MEIYKLKVKEVKSTFILVENEYQKTGIIHISQISNGFERDLNNKFKVNMVVYGVEISKGKEEKEYSLKIGHNKNLNSKGLENGGGFLALQKFLNKKGENNDNK